MGTLTEELMDLLRNRKKPQADRTIEEEREPIRKASQFIPPKLWPKQALELKKKQREDLDEQTKE